MRNVSILSFFVLLMCCITLNAQTHSVESSYIPTTLPSKSTLVNKSSSCTITCNAKAYERVTLSLEGLLLKADSGILSHDVEFSVATMAAHSVATLEPDMVNLTSGAYAYRLLPHGEHFLKPAQLQLSYNSKVLPEGFHPEDIYTYYYDEATQRWTRLERLSVDSVNHIVLSQTTHFTDFINAVIRTPEMPETNAFVPTQIKEIEAPNPVQHLTIIAEPQVNNYGSAQITYPIEIPVGRNGLQPDVSLSYNSSNGNGILGYGWSIMQPAMTIDTRWGVPRYDSVYESEIYTLNGMQCVLKDGNPNLMLPYQSNDQISRQSGNVTFVARDTKNCDRIIRHGSTTKNYWWEVIDRDGTVSYYGKYAGNTSVNPNCVLKDSKGNIGYWALAEIVDIFGNFIKYEYAVSPSNEIYLKRIYYTGHKSSPNSVDLEPSYRIFFHYDQREDILRDGRLGFVRQTDSILCYIDATYLNNNTGNQPFCPYMNRRFLMLYNDSAPVSLLSQIEDHINHFDVRWPIDGDCSIPMYNGNDVLNGVTSFDYLNPLLTPVFAKIDTIPLNADMLEKSLSLSENSSWNVGGTATVGFGNDVWETNFSVGGNYNFSRSNGKTKQLLLDINGDGLTDFVFIENDSIYYRPQYYEDSRPSFGDAVNTGIPAKGLSAETSDTHSWGLQTGVEVYVAHANVSGGMSYSKSYTTSYFADVNNDGLPDYIDDGKIYFNLLQTHNGFVAHSGETEVIVDSAQCVHFWYDGEVEVIPDCYERDTIVASYVYHTPDCSLGSYGTEPQPIPVHPWDTLIHCEECDSLIIEYLSSGECPIDLYISGSRAGTLQNDSVLVSRIDTIQRRGRSLEGIVFDCLRYCGAELPCKECWEYYLDGDWEHYEQCKEDNGCRTLCGPCAYHLLTNDEQGYLDCMNDTCLGGTLYTVSTPCYDCEKECLQDVNNCVECIESNPLCMVCEECEQECTQGIDACMECKAKNNCLGYFDPKCVSDFCYGTNADTSLCADCILSSGYYCAECIDTCLLYPELCSRCVRHHCHYDDMEAYINACYEQAASALNQWKNSIRQQYGYVTFEHIGNTYYAHRIDTICPPSTEPEIEAVRVWVAPKNGTITLQSVIQLLEDTGYNRRQARQVDGVRCVIQHHKNITVNTNTHTLHASSSNIIGVEDIAENDYAPRNNTYTGISVKRGDVLFFHLRSVRTHNFDNVNWTQTITYQGDSIPYSSVNDFICSSDNLFQSNDSGTIVLNADIACPVSASALLSIMVDNNPVDSIVINSAVTHSTKQFVYPNGSKVSLQLSSADNLGQIEVRPYLSFTPDHQDSTHRPYGLWLAPQVVFTREVELDSTYYNLFGPLYKGWGQFGYNNTASSNDIPISSLSNAAVEYARTAPSDSANFCQTIMFEESDTTQLKIAGSIEEEFSDRQLYNPLDNAWIQMTPDIRQYRWEAYGRVARNGRTLLSNTRDTKAMFESLLEADSTYNVSEVEYDSEVPVLPDGQRVTAIRKESKTTQWNVNAGFGVAVLGGGRTYSESDYSVTSDYMDMNGDGYPDIIHSSSIQYTQPWGGLGNLKTVNKDVYTNHSITAGGSISGHQSFPVKAAGINPKDGKYYLHAGGSVGGNVTTTGSGAAIAYMDVNSDGLPDKLSRDGVAVSASLNVGYGFAQPFTLIDTSLIDMNISESVGGSAGIDMDYASVFQMSLAFGIDASESTNKMLYRLMDMNGDGYLDIVKQVSEELQVTLMSPLKKHDTIGLGDRHIQKSKTGSWGTNLGLTVGFPIWVLKIGLGINGSPGGYATTQVISDLMDMNGDGLPDFVWCDNDNMYVLYNQSGKNCLLTAVTNPTGQKYLLDYELSAPTYEQRGRQWLMTRVSDIDPYAHPILGNDTIVHTFTYADPHYDYAERQFLGYGTTVSYDINTDTLPHTDYRKTIRHYNNHDFVEHGKMTYEGLMDADEHLYREYEIGTWYVDSTFAPTDNLCSDASIRVGTEVHYTRYYEGGDDPIVAAKKYVYDAFHNVQEYTNFGDTSLLGDELKATIEYDSADILTHNLVSLPSRMAVYNNGVVIRQEQADYQNGKLTELRRVDPASAASDTTNYHYDSFGMPDSVVFAANLNGQRAFVTIAYDSFSHTLPETVTDQWNRIVQTTYDKYWKTPLTITDPSGYSIEYTYDTLGRLATVSAPEDTTVSVYVHPVTHETYYSTTRNITIRYAYSPRSDLGCINKFPYVRTFIPSRNIQKETFYDNRGEMMFQKENWDTYDYGSFEEIHRQAFSDITAKDCFGRTKTVYRNYIDYRDSVVMTEIDSLHILSSHSYDVLDRPLLVHWQDGTHQTNTYAIGEDAWGAPRLKHTLIDELGRSSVQFTTPQGWTTTSAQPDNTITSFTYDALGQLLSSHDPDGMVVTHSYDGLGRRTERHHPDAGTSRWTYDNAGNIISTATQTQIDNGTQTEYDYDYNRIVEVNHPQHQQLNITYEYDSVGRVSKRTDITGYETFEYDALGNVSVSDRLLVVPSDTNAYRFRMQFEYDPIGNIKYIIYPDSERIHYTYEHGYLDYLSGRRLNGGPVYNYINYLNYDAYRRPVRCISGNDYTTDYTYDMNRQWLSGMQTYSSQHDLQDVSYSYDAVGNITVIEQNADSVHWLGGAYMLEYQYDSLNRLTKADMISDYFGAYSDYTMSYSPSGLVGIKSCDDMLWNYWHGYCSANNSIVSHQVRSIYDMDNDATTFFMWDASGRLQDIYRPCSGNLRHHWWNEADQLTAVVDNGHCAFYGYDGNGDRAYKLTGVTSIDQYNAGQETFHMHFNDAVLYVNPYFVVTPKGYTKHYYNGSQRIAAQIGQLENLPNDIIDTSAVATERIANACAYIQSLLSPDIELQPDTTATFVDIDGDMYDELQWQCTEEDLAWNIEMQCDSNILLPILSKDTSHLDNRVSGIYYYHPDHLGSATWITNSARKAVQFIHYMPFGEMWYNQQGSAYNERYKFTGKERDEETGYDYFGARYYVPEIPIWLSVDPLADKYPNISPYAYCGWNPVKFVDPDGKKIVVGTWYGRLLAKFGVNNFEAKTIQRLQDLKSVSPELNKAITSMASKEDVNVNIQPMSKYKGKPNEGVTVRDGKNSDIYYYEDVGFPIDGNYSSPDAILAHELGHAENNMNGTYIEYNHDEAKKSNGNVQEKIKGNANERQSIYYENQVRQKEGEPARSYDYYKANKETNQ